MSEGLEMLRDYIEHDALCMRRRKCCEIEDVLVQEMDALKEEIEKLKQFVRKMWRCYGYRSNDGDCSGCYYCNNGCEPMWDACRWECEMHKLGIDVDEDYTDDE